MRKARSPRRRFWVLCSLSLSLLALLVSRLFLGGAIDLGSGVVGEDAFERSSWQNRRGIYLTSLLASRPERLAEIIEQANRHGLNAIVIDVKDNHGVVAYDTQVPLARTIGAREVRFDLKTLVESLKARGLYVIARQVVFYDPKLASHLKSRLGPWVSPTEERVVAYNLAIAEEVAAAGFHEIQFDYIRYPDGGDLRPIYGTRYRAIRDFLRRAYERLHAQINLSADVFGRTLWDWNLKKIDPIGQALDELRPYVDLLSPMVYPSHYEDRRFWDDPYGTVKKSLQNGLERDLKMRPFLQAFEMRLPVGMTQEEYILEQIRAVRELGFGGYLFWNPEGNYDPLWRALARLGEP